MKSNLNNDNRARITGGGACFLYKAMLNYISGISRTIRGPDLAISKSLIAQKEWRFPPETQVEEELVAAAGGSEMLARLLVKRGIASAAEIKAFLDPAQYAATGPMDFPDMARAVVRVTQAIANKEKITIYGDYDVDGVTATAVMVSTLRLLGAEVDYYIPSRSDGYGINLKAVSVLASKHRTKLMIACDCGISNFSEINFARSLGVDTIVVDHHSMPDLMPPAVAILHPKQLAEDHPFFHLPGVGVAYKLSEALLIDSGHPQEVEKLLDFVTLGMIADMVPLTKECRYLVQIGMTHLVHSERAGIKALLNQVTTKGEGTDLVGFGLAPRINAVGRLADANLAVKLMITSDVTEAEALAHQLEMDNQRRQELCEQIFFEADQKVAQSGNPADRAIAIYNQDWHHGVVGIVASRLVEKYHCPVFIGELDPSEGIVKGSARGISGIDLYEVLKANEHLALKWGGHKMAAGFSVDASKADLFCKGIIDTCNRVLAQQSMRPVLDIDLEVEPQEVNQELIDTLSRLAPFGMANKKPILSMRGLSCRSSRQLGKEGKHSRVMIGSDSGFDFECVFWNSRGRVPADGQLLDAAFNPEMNHYNGNSRLQLVLADWRDPNQALEPVTAVSDVTAASTGEAAAVLSRLQAATQAVTPPVMQQSLAPVPAVAKPLIYKDMRAHDSSVSLLEAAVRKLGSAVIIFGESCPKIPGITFSDRSTLSPAAHLVLWSYPANLHLLKTVVEKTGASTIYLIGGAPIVKDDAADFLKRLLGLVRFAVNQRQGQADPEKVAVALGTTKMAIALGLTILKKINLIDWFAEDGSIFVDLLGQPTGKAEQLPEFRQLANCLREVTEFSSWCSQASLNEIQLTVVKEADKAVVTDSLDPINRAEQELSEIYQHDTANNVPANFSGKD